ncbi:MAG: hypothetical protein ACRDK9_08795 [Solirubrobacterales bacterium]
MQLRPGSRRPAYAGEATEVPGGRTWLIDRALRLASRASERPYLAIGGLFLANLLLIGVFVAAGEVVFADPAEPFRELMPGTWLSVAQLAFVAVIAWAIHRALIGARRLRLDNLWGASVAVFIVLAIDEATQLTIFASDALHSLGFLAPAGFKDLDAFLLTAVLLAAGAVLLRYGRALLAYPAALVPLAIGVALGTASQVLDSTLAVSTWEFVAEESLKLAAEPFLIGTYLIVLHRVTRR